MSAQGNINVIRTYWEALQHPGPASLQTMMGLMDEQIEWEVVPLGLRRHGRDEVIRSEEETSMAEPERRDGRVRDAQLAREAILDAAEAVFAQHGFDGARIEAIAKAAGYNVSLLFQYFGDKLGLYTAVLERAHRETAALQAHVLAPLLADTTMLSQVQAFRTFLETVVHLTFDYLVEHPRLLRMLTWEMAEGWQTYSQIAAHFPPDESDHKLEALFKRARRAGWLRSDFPAPIQLTLVFQVCQSYLAFLPLYQVMLPGEEVSSQRALSRAREHLVQFIVAGMTRDLPQATEEREGGRV